MNKDKDPIMSDIKLSEDELALRQRQMQARKAAAARSAQNTKAPINKASPAAKQTLAAVALILVVVVGALAGFLLMQLQSVQQGLAKAEGIIQAQAQNIEVLNEKLSVTGENANMSVDAIKSIVKDHDSEINKLWNLSNKRNRPDITANTNQIGVLGKEVNALKAETGKVKTSVGTQQAQVTATADRLTKVEAETKSLAEIEMRISQQNESIQSLQTAVAQLKKSGLGQSAAEIRLKLEDIDIRLDRLQNAVGQ